MIELLIYGLNNVISLEILSIFSLALKPLSYKDKVDFRK